MQKKPHIFLHKTVSKFLLGKITSKNWSINGKLAAIGFTLQLFELILKTAANPGETYTQSCAKRYEGGFELYRMKFDLV